MDWFLLVSLALTQTLLKGQGQTQCCEIFVLYSTYRYLIYHVEGKNDRKKNLDCKARHVFAPYFISQLHQQVIDTADKISLQ